MPDSVNLKKSTTERSLQSPNDQAVVRVVRWYEKNGDCYVGEAPIHSITLSELQALFAQPGDDPMVECYAISRKQVERIQAAVSPQMNLDLYDYFLESDAV